MSKEDTPPHHVSWAVLSAQGACPSPIASSSSTQEGTVQRPQDYRVAFVAGV